MNTQARTNMVKQQIRACNVLDDTILNLIANTPRDQFVPAVYREVAYADTQIPLAHEQVMFAPKEEGQILQACQIRPDDNVLEIGTGTGYFTALLSQMAAHVTSVDIFPEFIEAAQKALAGSSHKNVALYVADAAMGYAKHAPYDVMIFTGGLYFLPEAIKEQMAPGGRICAIMGEPPAMCTTLFSHQADNTWHDKRLFETQIPYLLHVQEPQKFVF